MNLMSSFHPKHNSARFTTLLRMPAIQNLVLALASDLNLLNLYITCRYSARQFDDPGQWSRMEMTLTRMNATHRVAHLFSLMRGAATAAGWDVHPTTFKDEGPELISVGVVLRVMYRGSSLSFHSAAVHLATELLDAAGNYFLVNYRSADETALFGIGEHELDIVVEPTTCDGQATEVKTTRLPNNSRKLYRQLAVVNYVHKFAGWPRQAGFAWIKDQASLTANLEQCMVDMGNPLSLSLGDTKVIGCS